MIPSSMAETDLCACPNPADRSALPEGAHPGAPPTRAGSTKLRTSGILAVLLTCLAALFVAVPPLPSSAADPPKCAVSTNGTYQPRYREVALALERTAAGEPRGGYPDLQLLKVGTVDPQLKDVAVPCILVKSIAFLESSWRMASGVQQGTVGSALISGSCGYGVMQVTWGMRWPDELPYATQHQIASDYEFNIAWGMRMLADRWNATEVYPPIGDRNPAVIENWYYAVWGYNNWNARNNPNNPDMPWPRLAFNGTQSRGSYPYQEMVWGLAANPPQVGGQPLWEPVTLTLPKREQVGTTPSPLPMPDPAHMNACPLPSPASHIVTLPWLSRFRR